MVYSCYQLLMHKIALTLMGLMHKDMDEVNH